MTHHTLLQVAPYAHLIAWGAVTSAAVAGGLTGAIIGMRFTRLREKS